MARPINAEPYSVLHRTPTSFTNRAPLVDPPVPHLPRRTAGGADGRHYRRRDRRYQRRRDRADAHARVRDLNGAATQGPHDTADAGARATSHRWKTPFAVAKSLTCRAPCASMMCLETGLSERTVTR